MVGLLAIVPARAGSKRVPGKNKTLIKGLPVIEYTIRALEVAKSITGIVVTTDDKEILTLYRDRTSIHLIERPASLAHDTSPTADAVAHALRQWKATRGNMPQALLLAQPTTPLRTAADIDAAFHLFERSDGAPLVSACQAEGIRHPTVMYRGLDERGRGQLYMASADEQPQRQDQERIYQRNGAIYIVKTKFFLRTGRMRNAMPVIYEMPWERSINIDVPGDLLIARALIESGLIGLESQVL